MDTAVRPLTGGSELGRFDLGRRNSGRSDLGRRIARWSLVGLQLVVGGNAVYGGIGLMAGGLGMPADWLDGTPFDSWLLPGIFLLAVVALPMIGAAVAELLRSPWAYTASLAAGALQVGWILAQLAILQRYFFLQPVMLGAGAAVAGLAWWAHRGEPLRPPAAG